MKKSGANAKVGKQSPLSSAIKDLDDEIKNSVKERTGLKKEFGDITSAIEVDHQKEKELQEKIAALIDIEAKLKQKKKNLQEKMDKVSDKMSKISKIKSEMADI